MFSPKMVFAICNEKGFKCYYCGVDAETLDHFIPRSKGGADTKANYVPTCRKCNYIKRNFDIEQFRQIVIRKIYKIPYFNKQQMAYLKLRKLTFEMYTHTFYFEAHKLKVPKSG